MGYTHYWTQTRDLTGAEMTEIGGVVSRFIEAAEKQTVVFHDYSNSSRSNNYTPETRTLPVVICGGLGEGKPEVDAERIWLNGQGPDYDHETFLITAKRELPYDGANPDILGWSFCKTARKPYDVLVVATLAYLAQNWGFEIGSDGGPDDWVEGLKLASDVLGEDVPCPLTEEN